jgi:serine/threonine-protein kinase ATR
MFVDLISLADKQTSEATMKIGAHLRYARRDTESSCRLDNFVVPLTSTLTVALPPKTLAAGGGGGGGGGGRNGASFPCEHLRIGRFEEQVEVYPSKAKPKKISVMLTSGARVNFLVKKELNGDLRKDARLMEFAVVVNRLLAGSGEARRRRLRLRTYSVLCLNEESGVLEWLDGTRGLRFAI